MGTGKGATNIRGVAHMAKVGVATVSRVTTIRIFTQEIGSSCMKLLVEKLHSGSQGVITRWVETELVERESVGCQVTLQAKSRTAKALNTPRPEDKRRA
jgi:DNA-binding LacI/PurR family transcriptional regulator